MKHLFKYKYPKSTILLLCIIIAYFIFSDPSVQKWNQHLGSLGYLGILIAGFLFSFGFSAPFSIGYLIISNPENIILATLIAGIGATISTLAIFASIKLSFMDEFRKLERTKPIKFMEYLADTALPSRLHHYLSYALIGFIIASPLPNEIGVYLLANLTKIKSTTLAIVGFILNSLGIYIILRISAG